MPNRRKKRHSPNKKAYHAPRLTSYGSIRKLTMSTLSGAQGDGGVHPANKQFMV